MKRKFSFPSLSKSKLSSQIKKYRMLLKLYTRIKPLLLPFPLFNKNFSLPNLRSKKARIHNFHYHAISCPFFVLLLLQCMYNYNSLAPSFYFSASIKLSNVCCCLASLPPLPVLFSPILFVKYYDTVN